MSGGRILRLAIVVAATALHAWVCWTIVRQPLDPHVPPLTPRTPVWRLYFDAVESPGPGADFFAVYHAGIQASRGETPYGRVESPQVTPYFYIFRYHPVVAATLGRVLISWRPALAYRLWVLLVEGTFLALLVAVARHRLPPWVKVGALTAMLVQFPYFLELHMGQFTFVAAAVTALTVMGLHRGSRTAAAAALAGVPLAAVSVLKQFPLFAVAGLVATRRGRIAALSTGLVTAAVLSPLVTDLTALREYALLNLVDDTVHLYPGNFSVMYQVFATSVFGGVPFHQKTVAIVSIAGSLLVIALCAIALVRSGTRDIRRTSGTLMAAFFLGYFRVWEHHFTAVLVGGLLVLVSLTAEEYKGERGTLGLLLFGLALLAAPSPFALLPADPRSWGPAAHYLLAWPKIMGTLCVVVAGAASPQAPLSKVAGPGMLPAS